MLPNGGMRLRISAIAGGFCHEADSDYHVRKDKSMSIKNRKVVRMLEKVVDLVFAPHDSDGKSGLEPGESSRQVRRMLKKLAQLAEKDPDNSFGTYLTRLQLKILKRLRTNTH
jgi:hypothetical protein